MGLLTALALYGCAETPEQQPGAGAGGAGGTGAGTDVPCEVQQVVQQNCGTCHGAQRVGGAPMSLVTLADFHADYAIRSTTQLAGQTMKVHQLAKIRVNAEMGTMPMPAAPMAPTALATLNTWFANGAPGGTACGAVNPMGGAGGAGGAGAGGVGGIVNPMGGSGGAGGVGGGLGGEGGVGPGGAGGQGGTGGDGITNLCDATAAYQPLVARDGEMCWEFLTHDGDGVSPFQVVPDESYNQIYYDVPWPADHVATRFGAAFDNEEVLHHWLGFETNETTPAGTVAKNVTGSTGGSLGGGWESKLFGGWAVGGCNVEFPAEMGLELPDPGGNLKVMIQWHHFNYTGTVQPDSSRIQVCTVPGATRPHVGGLTWLGTEALGNDFLPGDGTLPGQTTKHTGTCLNETAEDITIVAFWPHMHEIGTHMYTEVIRADGMVETVFDKPFRFNYQVHYDLDPYVVLNAGDKIRAECTFVNMTQEEVDFGQSTKEEMCYQFAFSYPAGALDKPGNDSLIGATNTCWGD
jgi:hypothetical protein